MTHRGVVLIRWVKPANSFIWLTEMQTDEEKKWRYPKFPIAADDKWMMSFRHLLNCATTIWWHQSFNHLIVGSSLVALLPMNIKKEHVSTVRIKEPKNCLDSWHLWIFTVWHSFLFCFVCECVCVFSSLLINVSQKKRSPPSSGLDSHSSCECELKETKAFRWFICRSPL